MLKRTYDTDIAFRKEIDRYHKIALSHNSDFNKDVYEFMANTLEPSHMAILLAFLFMGLAKSLSN